MLTALLIGVVILVLFFVISYNSFVSVRNHVKESWSGVDVQLKRRYDLIPNLVNTVKGYAKYEKDLLEKVTSLRNQALNNIGRYSSQAKDENQMLEALKSVFAVAENYPDLKASKNFLQLQLELAETEDKIAAARRLFNGNVRDLNNKVQMFPSSIVASIFNFKEEDFFEVEDNVVRKAVKIDM